MNAVVEKDPATIDEYERIFERYLEVCNQAIEKNKDYENPHFYIGSCKGTVHDFNGALKEFNIAIEKHSDTLVYARRAKIKVQLKDLVGACEDYYNSAQLGSILSREIFDRNCYTKPKDK